MLAWLATRPPLDGEEAVKIARTFLVRMGVRVADLNHLSEQQGRSWRQPGKVWAVGFDLVPEGWFSANVNERGVVFYACRSERKGSAPPLGTPTAQRYAQALMRRVLNAVPVRMGDVGRGAMPGASVQFHALVGGRRYFNMNPTYGYRISFDETGALTWFGREDVPPPPVARVAKVGQAAALAKLTEVWKAKRQAPTWPYPRHVEAELGYYAVKGEPRARLVWHGEVFSDYGEGRKSQFTTLDTFVDASTGDLVKADDR